MFLPCEGEKLDWELFLSATHHQVPPGCSHCHHMLYFPFKCEHSQSLHLLPVSVPSVQRESSGMSSGMNSVWIQKINLIRIYSGSEDHTFFLFIIPGYLGVLEESLILLSLPSPLSSVRDSVCCNDVDRQHFFASLSYATFSPNIITYSHPRRNILPGPNLIIQ